MALQYGLLKEADWGMVRQLFAAYGGERAMPQPGLARIAVALDGEDKVQGMLTLQLVPHMEPIWLSDEAKGEIRFTRLVEVHEQLMVPGTEYFAFAPDSHIEQMARLVGMVPRNEWKIMHKVVTGVTGRTV